MLTPLYSGMHFQVKLRNEEKVEINAQGMNGTNLSYFSLYILNSYQVLGMIVRPSLRAIAWQSSFCT
jgi:hypothetical protein